MIHPDYESRYNPMYITECVSDNWRCVCLFGKDVCLLHAPSGESRRVFQQQLKFMLKLKFQHLPEEFGGVGNVSCLDEIYTKVFIMERRAGGVNEEHEVRQIQAASWRADREDQRGPSGLKTSSRLRQGETWKSEE